MKVYFVRHGESEYNAKNLFQDGKVLLSKKGEQQAQVLAKRFLNIPVNIIISSPYPRAKKTAEIINKKIKKEIIFSELIGERKMPKETIGKYAYSDELIKIKELMRNNAKDSFWHYSDEENYSEFKNRIDKFFKYLNNLKEENVLVVGHGGPIRMTILNIMFLGKDIDPEIYYKFNELFRITNTGITMCEKHKDGRWDLWTFNDIAHLGEK